jgi:hypothetical protein
MMSPLFNMASAQSALAVSPDSKYRITLLSIKVVLTWSMPVRWDYSAPKAGRNQEI